MIRVNAANFHEVIQGARPVAMIIKSPSCRPCMKGYALFESIIPDFPNIDFAIYEIQKGDNKFLVNTLEVRAVPTFDVYVDGQRVLRTTSSRSFEEYKEFLDTLQ